MNYQLISAIRKGKWAIDPKHVVDNLGFVASLLNGTVSAEGVEENKELRISSKTNTVSYWQMKSGEVPEGSVGIVQITGELFKQSQFCGPVGMAEIGKRIQEMDNNSSITSILMIIDSPGGTVDGTETLANIVKETSKPVIALVDGLMASAALWVGTSADEVYASTEMDEVGSIGVLLSFMDIQPYYEKLGVKFHTVTADQSKDKTKMFEDLRSGNYDDYKKDFLNPLAERFQGIVKENRPNVKDGQLTGKVYFAKDVVGTLIDGIMTLDQVIERALELGQSNSLSNSNKEKAHMNKFSNINTALGVEALESVDGYVSLSEEQLSAIDKAIGDTSAQDDLSVQLEKAREDHVKAIEEKEALISSLKEENQSLKEAAAGGGATETSETEVGDRKSESEKSVSKGDNITDDLDAVAQMANELGV
jgi:signal peptide peptidase SppA